MLYSLEVLLLQESMALQSVNNIISESTEHCESYALLGIFI